ncbi:MAG: inorganic phosphate transporter [Verrucomicrobia bacterium]|nr:inorganic phosphate transporter [Verrucomicrobiota bacterium]
MALALLVILVALMFEYINGFHDTANSIATVVSTKVLTPGQAVMMSAIFNLAGALAGTAVASTIGKGLVDIQLINTHTILSALLAGIIWNLVTWWVGLPSSSSHALIGGLCGAALASAHNDWSAIKWSAFNAATQKWEGLWPKVAWPMFAAPVCGLLVGFLFVGLLTVLFRRARPGNVNHLFARLQLLSSAWMSFSHGTNDAQKTMGVIALTLFSATTAGAFDHTPAMLSFLKTDKFEIHIWVKIACALTMAAGTAAGGWRIIKTLGHKMVKLQKIHGFAAQTTAAAVIQCASHMGMPLSTTHVISSSIMGVGSAKRLNAIKWTVVERMVWAWLMTLPVSGAVAWGLVELFRFVGFAS